MSIIHQALKKAAAEAESTHSQPTILKSYPGKRFYTKFSFLIFLSGLVFFIFFILLAKSLWPTFPFPLLKENFALEQGNKAKNTGNAPSPAPGPSLSVSTPPETPPVPDSNSDIQRGEAALKEGLGFYNQGKMDFANENFAKAVLLLPLSPVAHNNLGLTLRNQGKTDEAIEHYQEAIRLNPNYAEGLNNLGMAHDQRGSIDQASSYYQKAIRLKPAVPEFHLNYATWLERKGDFVKARQEYQRYLDLESSNGGTSQKKESIALVKARLAELKGF
jgi:tetratricopeptide (TPR) repeat protein